MELTQKRLKQLVHYSEETGVFTRLSNGAICGSTMTGGYRRMRLEGKVYLCHRLAWFYVYGCLPQLGIDHINNKTDDNSITNLREANHSENSQNQTKLKANKHGIPGVTWLERNKKWKAKIRINGKSIYLGLFTTAEEASKVYLAKKREIHPFFSGTQPQ